MSQVAFDRALLAELRALGEQQQTLQADYVRLADDYADLLLAHQELSAYFEGARAFVTLLLRQRGGAETRLAQLQGYEPWHEQP